MRLEQTAPRLCRRARPRGKRASIRCCTLACAGGRVGPRCRRLPHRGQVTMPPDLGRSFMDLGRGPTWRGHSPAIRGHVPVILVSLYALLLVVPFAHATPPDATWIAGTYDDGDLDQVLDTALSLIIAKKVAQLVRTSAVVPDNVRPTPFAGEVTVWRLQWPTPGRALGPCHSASDTRSPPAA